MLANKFDNGAAQKRIGASWLALFASKFWLTSKHEPKILRPNDAIKIPNSTQIQIL